MVFLISKLIRNTAIFHITGKFSSDIIWDFIRDVFKFYHITNKYLAKPTDYTYTVEFNTDSNQN